MRRILATTLLALSLSACKTTSGVVSPAETGYVQFTGHWRGAVVQFNGGKNMPIEATGDGAQKFAVKPGKHDIKVTRGATLLVDRTVFISDGQTMEVRVP